jgi:hypothetical protein
VPDDSLPRRADQPRSESVRSQFNLNKALYVLRIVMCLGLILCSIAASVYAAQWLAAALLCGIVSPIAGFIAWLSFNRLKIEQPVVALGRNGIWDRRFDMDLIPWTEVAEMRLDGGGNLILDPAGEFSGLKGVEFTGWERFPRKVDPSMRPGSLKIRLSDVSTTGPEVLRAIDSFLPYDLRALKRPNPSRHTQRSSSGKVVAGFGVVVIALLAFLLIVGPEEYRFVILSKIRGLADIAINAVEEAVDEKASATPGKQEAKQPKDSGVRIELSPNKGTGKEEPGKDPPAQR